MLRHCVVGEELGRGSFSRVLGAVHGKTGEKLAVKVGAHEWVKREATVLQYLRGCVGVPTLYAYGRTEGSGERTAESPDESPGDSYLIIPRYEYNGLEWRDVWTQGLAILEAVHARGIVHRDVKPANFMQRGGRLVLIDFGMAGVLRGERPAGRDEGGAHGVAPLLGNVNYMSLRVHAGCAPGAADDVESLVYVCMCAYLQFLPWNGADAAGVVQFKRELRGRGDGSSWWGRCLAVLDKRGCAYAALRKLGQREGEARSRAAALE